MFNFKDMQDDYRVLRFIALKRGLQNQDVDEVVQESMIKIFTKQSIIEGNARGFWRKSAFLVAQQYARSEQRCIVVGRRDKRDMEAILKFIPSEVDVEKEYAAKERQVVIKEAIHSLPPRQRMIIQMIYDGESLQDIAQLLNMTYRAVYMNFSRGSDALRKKLI